MRDDGSGMTMSIRRPFKCRGSIEIELKVLAGYEVAPWAFPGQRALSQGIAKRRRPREEEEEAGERGRTAPTRCGIARLRRSSTTSILRVTAASSQ